MPKAWRRVTPEIRVEMIRLAAKGATKDEIARQVGRSYGSVCLVLNPLGGVIRKEMWDPARNRLTIEDRVEIRIGLEQDLSLRAIAGKLGRHPSTVSREVKANGGRNDYGPTAAHRRAHERTRRPKVTKLAANPELCVRVVADLEQLWSPEQIAKRLRGEFGDDPGMRISHETIYKTIYVQGRGELRRELARCLRTGRAKRVRQGRLENRGRIPDMVMISERPAEVEDRAVPGHWEGDLDGQERQERDRHAGGAFDALCDVAPAHRGEDRGASPDGDDPGDPLPESLRRTLTWDQGREMAEHIQFRIDTLLRSSFALATRLEREHQRVAQAIFPKGMDLSKLPVEQIQAAADGLNGRPRETLNWKKPAEKLAEVVASTG